MADKTPNKIEVAVPTPPPSTGDTKKQEVEVAKVEIPETPNLEFSKDTVFFILYLMYKSNMISRVNLKQMLNVVEKPLPENVAAYLVKEAARA